MGLLRLSAQLHPDVIGYINSYKSLAMQEMVRSGVPAAITLAQGIHESQSGKSDLVNRSNNHFGIKCRSSWTGDRVYHDDDARGECFRSYPSAEDSYRDHSDFLKGSPRYAFLFDLNPEDYKGWAYGLKRAGYATNVRYSQILVKLIEQYNLQQYSLIAVGKIPVEQEVLLVAQSAGGPDVSVTGPAIASGMEDPMEEEPEVPERYPEGVFRVNDTRVVYAPAGTSLLAVAEAHQVTLAHLLDFNDLDHGEVLQKGQLLFLQRKRKKGEVDYHVVLPGETLYAISQKEGVRLESLLSYNHLSELQQPAYGERIYLRETAPSRPALANLHAAPDLPERIKPAARSTPSSAPAGQIRHRVQSRETLFGIARQYGATVEQLMNWNNLSGTQLKVGQELIIFKQ